MFLQGILCGIVALCGVLCQLWLDLISLGSKLDHLASPGSSLGCGINLKSALVTVSSFTLSLFLFQMHLCRAFHELF